MKDFRIIRYDSPEYGLQVQLRYDVLRAPLGLKFTEKDLLKDEKDLMFGCFMDGRLVGCCQMQNLGNGVYQLRQMAVAPDMQGKNIGKELVIFVENYIKNINGQKITLHARAVAQGFYERLGYHIEGGVFEEVGIPHYAMEKDLI